MDYIPFATMEIRVAPFLSRDPKTTAGTWGEFASYKGRVEPRTLTAYADTADAMHQQIDVTAYIQCPAPLPSQVKLRWTSNGVTLEAPSLSVENFYDPGSGRFVYARVIT